MKKIIITEEQLDFIKDNKAYTENNSSEVFNKEIRHFIYNLMKGDLEDISDYWALNGIKKSEVYKTLIKYNVIQSVDGEFLVPKKNFDNKVNRIYYEIFGDQEPGLVISEDDGGGMSVGGEGAIGGATTASSSGSYEVPIFGEPIRRKIANITK